MNQRKTGREREVRCLNCFTRFKVPANASRATCHNCGLEWRISWASATTAKIRGPVWERMKGQS